jgi:hypothetical protein
MIALPEDLYFVVQQAAAPVTAAERPQFLAELAAELEWHPVLGAGVVHRACAEMQRKFTVEARSAAMARSIGPLRASAAAGPMDEDDLKIARRMVSEDTELGRWLRRGREALCASLGREATSHEFAEHALERLHVDPEVRGKAIVVQHLQARRDGFGAKTDKRLQLARDRLTGGRVLTE